MVLVDAEVELPQDLGRQTTTDRPTPVIGDDGNAPGGVSNDAVAPFAPNPSEARSFGHPGKVTIPRELGLGHATAAMCQVSTKSVSSGASGSTTFK